MANRIRIVGIALLTAGIVLAGSSTATFAQDDEYTVIRDAWSEFLGESWSDLTPAEATAYEADFIGLMEDATVMPCRTVAGAMSQVPSLVTGTEAEWYAGQFISQSVEAGLFHCYFSN